MSRENNNDHSGEVSRPPSATRVSPLLRTAIAASAWALIAAAVVVAGGLAFSVSTADAGAATREVLFNIAPWVRWLVYAATIVVFAVIASGPLRRLRLWQIGRPEKRWDRPWQRARSFLLYGVGQGRLPNDLYASIMHLCIFWGWSILFLGTVILAIHDELAYFLEGRVYLAYSAVLDIFGLLAFAGLAMALVRMYGLRPPKLRLGSLWDDALLLWLMLAVVVTGFFVEGLRIGANELPGGSFEARGASLIDGLAKDVTANPDWAPWSPAGYALAQLFEALRVDRATMLDMHRALWWVHLITALTWTAWLGYGKLSHIILGSANIFLRNLSSPRGAIAASSLRPIDFETEDTFGAGRLAQFSWKQLADVDVCVRCGRCESNCPAWMTGKALTPMGFLQDIKSHLSEVGPRLRASGGGASEALVDGERLIAGDVVSRDVIWDCLTCGACEVQCPLVIEHVGSLQDMRRHLVMMEGDMPPSAQAVLEQLEQRGHPWRGTTLTRTSWMEGLDIPTYDGSQEYLYWVGCAGALVQRNVAVTRAVARLMLEANVSFGCLGEAESCSGDPARRLGNEYLAQEQIHGVVGAFAESGVHKVVTNCPHCFNTFRNEYPHFGGNFEVYHHTQLLDALVREGRIRPVNELAEKVTYHDSCYLGRYNNEYDAPRHIIEATPGIDFVEMPRSRKTSFCCGAGGGHMFVEESKGSRINHVRVEEAESTGAEIVVSNCPFCVQMLEDGAAAVAANGKRALRTLDVAELLELTVITKDRGE